MYKQKATKMIALILMIATVFTTSVPAFASDRRTLRKGMSGEDVGLVQHMLNETLDAGLAEDNIFGSQTYKYVKVFQHQYGLVVDGIVGSKTWSKLTQVYEDLSASQNNGKSLYVKNGSFPDDLYEGQSFEVSGTVRCTSPLDKLTLRICDTSGKDILSKTFKTSSKTFDLSKMNDYIDFADLAQNDYTLTIEVKNDINGWVDVVHQEFSVNDPFVSTSFAKTESLILRFSKSEDGDKYISDHFRISEFACRASDTILLDRQLVALLEQVRTHFNVPLIITSGYRPPAYNASVKGAKPQSNHTKGMAADCYLVGIDPLDVAIYVQDELNAFGIGWYPEKGVTHLDTRPSSKRFYWLTDDQIVVSSFSDYK